MIRENLFMRNRVLVGFDILLAVISVCVSFALRLELGNVFNFYVSQMLWMAAISAIVRPFIFYRAGIYRRIWAYASINELKLIFFASMLASLFVGSGVLVMTSLQSSMGVFSGFPRSAIMIDAILSFVFVGGSRLLMRMLAENQRVKNKDLSYAANVKRILVVGAGSAGTLVVKELEKNPQIGLKPVAFLDDDKTKINHIMMGIPVVGAIKDLQQIVLTHKIDEVIIAIPTATGQIIRDIAEACRKADVNSRTMPGIYELIGGAVNITRLRKVEITDLLRREPVQIDSEKIGRIIKDKTVMVTGAGGSIGRELCRQIARWGPSTLILLGHGENSIFETLFSLQNNFPGLAIHPVIADIRDSERLRQVYARHQPEVVFHAAAHKHVPMMEVNIEEAITNNILGTQNVVNLAVDFGVERLVMISSDKAVRPTSVMGATKRIAEMVVVDKAQRSGTEFSVVRFGNVLGSRGSIVPIFQRQIARGGPVTVTHPEMQRFFMTIPEAVNLVLQAATMGSGGEVFVLNMGDQIKIVDLARDLIALSGLEPGKDIEIVFTGVRPGEKLSEELWENLTNVRRTEHSEIRQMIHDERDNSKELGEAVSELTRLAQEGDTTAILKFLDMIVPGATVSSTPRPDLISISS